MTLRHCVATVLLLGCSSGDINDTGEDTSLSHCMHADETVCSPSSSRALLSEYCDDLEPPGEFAEGDCPEGWVSSCTFPNGGREYYYDDAEHSCE